MLFDDSSPPPPPPPPPPPLFLSLSILFGRLRQSLVQVFPEIRVGYRFLCFLPSCYCQNSFQEIGNLQSRFVIF